MQASLRRRRLEDNEGAGEEGSGHKEQPALRRKKDGTGPDHAEPGATAANVAFTGGFWAEEEHDQTLVCTDSLRLLCGEYTVACRVEQGARRGGPSTFQVWWGRLEPQWGGVQKVLRFCWICSRPGREV